MVIYFFSDYIFTKISLAHWEDYENLFRKFFLIFDHQQVMYFQEF